MEREVLDDLVLRFAALARELSPQLLAQLPANCGPAVEPLAALLEQLLYALPAADARHHRYRLIRHVCEQLRATLAPLVPELEPLGNVDVSTSDPADESSLVTACVEHDAFRRLCATLHSELSVLTSRPEWAASLTDVLADVEHEPPSSSASEGSVGGAGTNDDLDRWLHDEMNADLPPFYELPGLITGLYRADTAHSAWARLRSFSASDLLECDQWELLVPALRHALCARQLAPPAVLQCVELHANLFDDAPPAQRASVLLNVAALVDSMGGGSSASEGAWATPTAMRCAQLLCRGRCALSDDGVVLGAVELSSLLATLFRLAAAPPFDAHLPLAAPGANASGASYEGTPIPVSCAGLLASLDPSARWLSRLLSRSHLLVPTWRQLVDSGMLKQAEATARQPLPCIPAAICEFTVPSTPAAIASDSPSSDRPLSTAEVALAISLHHTCVLGISVRHVVGLTASLLASLIASLIASLVACRCATRSVCRRCEPGRRRRGTRPVPARWEQRRDVMRRMLGMTWHGLQPRSRRSSSGSRISRRSRPRPRRCNLFHRRCNL